MAEPAQTLLVVDDNRENCEMLSRRLRKSGYEVLEARDGRQALALLASGRSVDLVLLDVMMPAISGLDVLAELRRTRSAAELPVIMTTARTDSQDVVEALEMGANDYVTKPLDFPVVLARIQAHLRVRPARPREPASAREVGVGTVLAGKYRLDAPLGSGAFGAVYRSTHLDLDTPVAVKVLLSGVNRQPEALARFRREGISACRIRHPNAVAVSDFGVTSAGVAYLVMELLEGGSLRDELELHGPLSPVRCAEILVPVCGVLAEAHAAGIIHRDVKPSNIFLHRTRRGEVVPKVLDFGIAKLVGGAALSEQLTVDGVVLGTLMYMAPERLRAGQAYDGRSDVYSLGVTSYRMLTGRAPFSATERDPMSVMSMHLHQAPPPLRSLAPELSAEVEAAVMQALDKDPERRPDAAGFARAFAQAAGVDPSALAPAAPRGFPALDPAFDPLTDEGAGASADDSGPRTRPLTPEPDTLRNGRVAGAPDPALPPRDPSKARDRD